MCYGIYYRDVYVRIEFHYNFRRIRLTVRRMPMKLVGEMLVVMFGWDLWLRLDFAVYRLFFNLKFSVFGIQFCG